MRLLTTFLVLFVLIVGGPALLAQGKGKGKGKGRQDRDATSESTAGDKVRRALPPAEMVFSERDRTVVRNWFRGGRSNLPPGLAKRDRLPPGLEKQLATRGTLPPGLQKRIQPLPMDLERQLPPLPTGWRRAVIAGNVILMNEKTRVVYDIIRNAIP